MTPKRVPIDLHKGLTAPVVLALMAATGTWTPAAWLYLALHGTYGGMWILKSWTFPDPAWEEPIPAWKAVGYWLALGLYWVTPVLVVTRRVEPAGWIVCLATTAVVFGTFLHFGSDAQKYFVLKARRGLITDGFFARTRNPNYLGEMLIYGGFAAVAVHWLPWLICAAWWGAVFLPNIRKKERSMARYPEWAAYVARTGLLLPRLTPPAPRASPP